jgi:hypothetical protein
MAVAAARSTILAYLVLRSSHVPQNRRSQHVDDILGTHMQLIPQPVAAVAHPEPVGDHRRDPGQGPSLCRDVVGQSER